MHGEAVNCPARGVPGRNWSGDETHWLHAAAEYGAIHFHGDDLEDAGWEADFELSVPEDLRSGVYAARLVAAGGTDRIPFFVRPKRGTVRADLVFLAPTLTYLAYANEAAQRTAEEVNAASEQLIASVEQAFGERKSQFERYRRGSNPRNGAAVS